MSAAPLPPGVTRLRCATLLVEAFACIQLLDIRYPFQTWPRSDPLVQRLTIVSERILALMVLGMGLPGLEQTFKVSDDPDPAQTQSRLN